MDRTSPKRLGRTAEKDRYIASLELEVDSLKDRCASYEEMVKELKLEINKLVVKVTNKKELRKKYNWNVADTSFSDTINKFCKEWLFPRCKFFSGDWMDYSDGRKSLASLVLKHCPLPSGADRQDAWDRVIAPTIAKKYSDMLCNITNNIKRGLEGK